MVAVLGGIAGLLLSFVLFTDRQHCEPLLAFLLPLITKALFRSALYYSPEQYYWIAGYVGGLSAAWTVAVLVIVARQRAENARIDAALMGKLGPDQAHGAPLEP
jgi:cyanate permease